MIQQFYFWYIPKRTESKVLKRYLYTYFIVALFTIAKMWKEPKYTLKDEQISKIQCIHTNTHIYTLDYYSAFKRNEILHYATTQMNSEDIMLSKISKLTKRQTLYDSIYMRYLESSKSWRQKV